MQTISFKLEVFEGPMDLLLNLISKHKLNIYDIEISSLLEQYLAYLDQCREQDLELAGEFLEMAARLIYIKTASLLPRPEDAQKEKQALQGALIEYALCKQAAQALAQRLWADRSSPVRRCRWKFLRHTPEPTCPVCCWKHGTPWGRNALPRRKTPANGYSV